MSDAIDSRVPSIEYLRERARRRMPRFAFEYLEGGCNSEVNLRRNTEEIRDIQQNLGLTSVYVTHDQREALVMSDEIIVMSDGVIQQTADPIRLYREPLNRFVANFIGTSNRLAGIADRDGVRIDGIGIPVPVPEGVNYDTTVGGKDR